MYVKGLRYCYFGATTTWMFAQKTGNHTYFLVFDLLKQGHHLSSTTHSEQKYSNMHITAKACVREVHPPFSGKFARDISTRILELYITKEVSVLQFSANCLLGNLVPIV